MRWLLLLLIPAAAGCVAMSPEQGAVRPASYVDAPAGALPPGEAGAHVRAEAAVLLPAGPDDDVSLLCTPGVTACPCEEPDDLAPPPLALNETCWPEPAEPWPVSLVGRVCEDHCRYYSGKNLGLVALGTGVAAIMANTNIDQTLRDNYQDSIRDVKTDEFSEAIHTSKVLGNGYVTIPAFAVSAILGHCFDEYPLGHGLGEWGERSFRTVLVGAPPMLAMQLVTGASRPGETTSGSHWKPFDDNNGVSGHSFMGAVPFISAAKMTDNPFWKAGFYAASTLAGLSRINDDRHYPSQVLLGWWMAYVAATAVDETQWDSNLTVTPLVTPDFTGVSFEYCR